MPMVKTITAHNGCSNIFKYLENERSIAKDFINVQDKENWGKEFDATRAILDHDKDCNAGKSITYRHIILSPDPIDNATPNELLTYAREWAETNFPGGQVAIYVQADTDCLHAHLCLNASNLDTLDKWHFTKGDVIWQAKTAQVIGARYGYRELPDIDKDHTPARRQSVRQTSPERYARSRHQQIQERRIKEKGYKVYKDELRKAITDSAKESPNFETFRKNLNDRGYDAWTTRKGITYKTPFEVKDRKTGKMFTLKCKDASLGVEFGQESLDATFKAVASQTADVTGTNPREVRTPWEHTPAGRMVQSKIEATLVIQKEGLSDIGEVQVRTEQLRNAADSLLKQNASIVEKIESLQPVANAYHEYNHGIGLVKTYNQLSGAEKANFIGTYKEPLEKAFTAERTLRTLGTTPEAASRIPQQIEILSKDVARNTAAIDRFNTRATDISRAGNIMNKTQGQKQREYLERRGDQKHRERKNQQMQQKGRAVGRTTDPSRTHQPNIDIDLGK